MAFCFQMTLEWSATRQYKRHGTIPDRDLLSLWSMFLIFIKLTIWSYNFGLSGYYGQQWEDNILEKTERDQKVHVCNRIQNSLFRRRLLHLPNTAIFKNDEMLGFMICNHVGSLNHLFVYPEHRGQGLAHFVEQEQIKKCIRYRFPILLKFE